MKKIFLASILVVAVVASAFLVWEYVNYLDYSGKTLHESERWAVILDSHGDIVAVEATSNEVWSALANMHQDGSEMWIGGLVEEYGNHWRFRFKPDTINVAEITAEGAQTWIADISENTNYWMNTWSKETYVFARVTEIRT